MRKVITTNPAHKSKCIKRTTAPYRHGEVDRLAKPFGGHIPFTFANTRLMKPN